MSEKTQYLSDFESLTNISLYSIEIEADKPHRDVEGEVFPVAFKPTPESVVQTLPQPFFQFR